MRFSWPILILCAAIGGCGNDQSPSTAPATQAAPVTQAMSAPQTVTVFAAASLKKSFTEIDGQFEKLHAGVTVTTNFAGSNQLRLQLANGAPADVFASANTKEMDTAVKANLVDPATVHIFARNRLALIVPTKNPAGIQSLADLAKPGLKLVLADPAVPAGNYAVDMLKRASADPVYGADFSDRVLKNVQSREENVEAVVSKVVLGEADAGIAYITDARAHVSELVTVDIPDALSPPAEYPLAVVTHAPAGDLAQQYADFVMSESGQAILAADGFTPPAGK